MTALFPGPSGDADRPGTGSDHEVPRTPWALLPGSVRRGVTVAVAVTGLIAVVVAGWPGAGWNDGPAPFRAPGLWLLCLLAVVVDALPHARPLRTTRLIVGLTPSLPLAIAAVLAYGPAGLVGFVITGATGPLLQRREPWRVLLSTTLSVARGLLVVLALRIVHRGPDWDTVVTTWRVLPLTVVAAGTSLLTGWAVHVWLRRLLAPVGSTPTERRWRPRRSSWYLPLTAPIPAALAAGEPGLLPLLGLSIVAAQFGVARVASQTALAGLDPLTGLANRPALSAALHRRLARRASETGPAASPVTLLLADLDAFKQINDVHGHLVGDEVLAVVGQRLQAAVRAADLPARMGGDEFAVLLERGGHDSDLGTICARIRAVVGEPLAVGHVSFRPQLTFGWAQSDRSETATELIARADLDLYRSKADRKKLGPAGPRAPGSPARTTTPPDTASRGSTDWNGPVWSGPVVGVGAADPGGEG